MLHRINLYFSCNPVSVSQYGPLSQIRLSCLVGEFYALQSRISLTFCRLYEKYILNLSRILFHSTLVSLMYFAIIFKVLSVYGGILSRNWARIPSLSTIILKHPVPGTCKWLKHVLNLIVCILILVGYF